MTSRPIASIAGSLLRSARARTVKSVAASDLSQAGDRFNWARAILYSEEPSPYARQIAISIANSRGLVRRYAR